MLSGYIYGGWPQRSESIDGACEKLQETFSCLENVDPSLTGWYLGYESFADRESGPTFVTSNPSALREAFKKSVVINHDGSTSPELGFTVTVIAGPVKGGSDQCTQIRITCCKSGPYSGDNTFNVKFPTVGDSAAELRRLDKIAGIIECFATIWSTDWIVFRDLGQQAGMPATKGRPHTGLVTYRSDLEMGSVPAIDGVEVRAVNSGGILIVPSSVPTDPSKFILDLQSVLDKAG